jgi:hypothetical protein
MKMRKVWFDSVINAQEKLQFHKCSKNQILKQLDLLNLESHILVGSFRHREESALQYPTLDLTEFLHTGKYPIKQTTNGPDSRCLQRW